MKKSHEGTFSFGSPPRVGTVSGQALLVGIAIYFVFQSTPLVLIKNKNSTMSDFFIVSSRKNNFILTRLLKYVLVETEKISLRRVSWNMFIYMY